MTDEDFEGIIEDLKAKLAKAEEERDEALNQLDSARHSVDVLEKRVESLGREVNVARYGQPDFAWSIHKASMADLEAKLAECEARLNALRAVVQYEASSFFGPDAEKNKRASWRGVMRKVKAALAEIEGEKG